MKKRKLRKSEWIVILAPLLAFAAVGGGPLLQRVWHRYFPVQLKPVELKGARANVEAISFSHNGKYLIASSLFRNSETQEITMWNTAGTMPIWQRNESNIVRNTQFSLDDKYVVWIVYKPRLRPDEEGRIKDAFIEIHDAKTGTLLHQWRAPSSKYVFLPTQREILCMGRSVQICNLETGALVRTLATDVWQDFFCDDFAVDAQGRYLVLIASGKFRKKNGLRFYQKGRLRVYELSTGRLMNETRYPIPSRDSWMHLEFSPDSKVVWVFPSGPIAGPKLKWLWRQSRECTNMGSKAIYLTQSSPDGKTRLNIIQRWKGKPYSSTFSGSVIRAENWENDALVWSRSVPNDFRTITFFADSQRFVCAEPNRRFGAVWQTNTGQLLKNFEGELFCPAPDSKTLAVASGSVVKLWDVSDLTTH